MLQIKSIRENKEQVLKGLKVRNMDAAGIIEELLLADDQRRKLQHETDAMLAEQKEISRKIGQLFKEGRQDEATKAKADTQRLKEEIASGKPRMQAIEDRIRELLVQLPNIPHELVPPGKGEDDNEEVERQGEIKTPEVVMPHWEIASKHDLIDFELGNKITGAGFPVYKKAAAKLQRALISFFLDEGEKAGYEEVLPPLLVNEASGFATGQLPDKEGQMYELKEDKYFLIPTAEVPVTNIYRDEILKSLPVKNMAYSACFRREAGSWGAHVRGLNRLHQFDKVEIVRVERPEDSYNALNEMLAHVSGLLYKLGLPFRVLRLCGGDLSFTSALTYDFEVYSAGQERWLEVSSVSNFESYQANRLKLRYRNKDMKKPELAHTLNGSALALPRVMAALLENNYTNDGIVIPEVLHKYTQFEIIK